VLVSVAGPPAPVPLGSAVTVTGNFTDPGAISDQFTFTSTWTGGPTPLTVTTGTVNSYNGNAGSFTITAPANIQSGVYTVKVTVTDRFGDSSNELTVLTYVVVFDPSGGFVTGGGWIDSPPGAYFDNPTLTGKANFGFVSKYKKGQSTPDGNTEFQFQTAGLNFKATSYEWLVIAGAKAQYKGSGTINGSGDYFFMLTATDGELKGKGVLDAFRIKIWRKDAAGTVVYDNLLNAPDSVDPTTFLGGGSIQIHDK